MSAMACPILHVYAEMNKEHFQVVVLILGSECKHCNLRPGPEPDGTAGRADAAIDVKFRASVFVPSAGVAIQQTTEVEAAADGLQRQLSAMRMPGKHQMNPQLGVAIDHEHRRSV